MRGFSFCISFIVLLFGCTEPDAVQPNETTHQADQSLNIATAANMKFAMDSITSLFEAQSGIRCNVNAASSGMLTAQIENGAPFDVFVSANMRYPERIIEAGKGKDIEVYARGKLILVYDTKYTYTSVEEALLAEETTRIGIADARTAPYGIAARQYLQSAGLEETVTPKLITGESIGQVNQYLQTKAVNVAFTSSSFITKFKQAYNYLEVDSGMFAPINQGVVLLDYGTAHHPEASKAFVDFLNGPDCKGILRHFGYFVD